MQSIHKGDFYQNLSKVIEEKDIKRILCVTGKNSFEKSGAKSALDKCNIKYTVYNDFSKNTKYEEISAGIELLNNFNPDIILAIGGGSVIDIAKLTTYFAEKDINNFEKTLQDNVDSIKTPLWVAPTTSGSGSEATHFAVVYKGGKKYSVAFNSLLPGEVFLDPTLTYTTPENIKKTSGIDALCQGIESYWASGATDESKEFSKQAIKTVNENLLPAINGDKTAMDNMQYGSYLAGRAINISKTTAGHAFSYHLTQKYNVEHGNAVCLMLGYVMEYSLNYDDTAQQKCNDIAEMLNINTNELPEFLLSLLTKTGLQNSLSDIGIDSQDKVDILCDSVNIQRLNNNPTSIELDKFKQLLGTKI
ncbi:MAG: phosphonoacetaldehyde reductase [Alphaproteobacteria bacterium]